MSPTGGPVRGGASMAALLTRALLLLYPPAFRKEVGVPLTEDVRRRAAELAELRGGPRAALWVVRLALSLVVNAPPAWVEELLPGRRARNGRRRRRERIADRASPSLEPSRGPASRSFSWLDVKLGVRMLVKHPGLTLAGGFGIAVGIGASAGFFAFAYAFFYPTIPLDEGHRLVGLENWDLQRNNEERRSLHDFVMWREEMRSVEDMSAFRTVSRNLNSEDGPSELVRIAEMTPSGFTLARVPALMGRTLVEADADPGAANVLVIGHEAWRTRFGSDPDIVGKDVRLGRDVYTIVGVMPAEFAFPMNHGYWTAFRQDPADYPLGEGPSIFISGRLAPGYTLDDAQAELTVIGDRMAAEHPDTHARFRAQVMPYIYPLLDVNQDGGRGFFWQFTAMNGFIALLLVLVGLNVAVLVYARTATRRGEIAVRTALGASRGRIVGQLFAESLVLAVLSAAAGLGLAKVGMSIGNGIMAMEVAEQPFWMELGIPGPAAAYVAFLTVLTAVLTGVLPGLQATGKRVQENLRQYHGGTGLRLGRTWTALIVIQVAVTVAGLPIAVTAGWSQVSGATTRPAYPVGEYMLVYVGLSPSGSEEEWDEYRQENAAYFAGIRDEASRRLAAEPAVVALAPAMDIPGFGPRVRVVPEGGPAEPESGESHEVRSSTVHPDFFPTYELPVLAGRPLLLADMEEGAPDVVVVDRTFVERVLGGGSAIGRRVRLVTAGGAPEGEERWHEIVGVTGPLHDDYVDSDRVEPLLFRPARSVPVGNARFLVRVAGVEPLSLTPRVSEIVTELDPTLSVATVPLTRAYRQEQLALLLVALVLALVAASVLLLSAAGIYALMSFTVSQRWREIAVRTALGAQRSRLLGGIFGRAAAQLGSGVAIGAGVTALLDLRAEGDALQGYGHPVLLVVMVLTITAVGLLATLGPARRGLRLEPAEVLKEE